MLKLFSVFNKRIWYNNNYFPDDLKINCIKCNKVFGYKLYNQTLKDIITIFVTNVVFLPVGIYWINNSKEDLKFDFDHHCPNWILNFPLCNTTICSHFQGYLFDDYFTTLRKYRYNLMCYIEAYKKIASNMCQIWKQWWW